MAAPLATALCLFAALAAPTLARLAGSTDLLSVQRAVLGDTRLSEVQCLGKVVHTRTCHFKDLYYDMDTNRFRVYTSDSTAASLLWEANQRHPGGPFLQLGMCVLPL